MSKITIIAALLTLLTFSQAQTYLGGVQVGTLHPAIDEASGLIPSLTYPDVFYTHNDSGGGPIVYVVRRDGSLIAGLNLKKPNGSNASADDMEEISIGLDPDTGVPHVYVGNFGDNPENRSSYDLHRFPEPVLNLNGTSSMNVTVETFNFVYPDGSHDCESMFIDPSNGDVYFLTKRDAKSGIYSATWPMTTSSQNTLNYHGDMTMNWLTAADISPCGNQILARQHGNLFLWERAAGQSIAAVLQTSPSLPPYEGNESKGESICFDRTRRGYYTTTENAPAAITYYAEVVGVEQGALSTPIIDEASGLAASRLNQNVLWTLNDENNIVYAINTSGQLLATYDLGGASGVDYEDIAVAIDPVSGVPHVYVADIGDNNRQRNFINVHRFPEPAVNENQSPVTGSIQAETFRMRYFPDGARNAEALFVDPASGDIYIVTKSDYPSKIYRASYPQSSSGNNNLDNLGTLDGITTITAADMSPDGKLIIAKTYDEIYLWEHDATSMTIEQTLAQRPFAIPYNGEVKGESLTWDPQTLGYYTTSEGVGSEIVYYENPICDFIIDGSGNGNGGGGGNGGNGGGLEPMADILTVEQENLTFLPTYVSFGIGAPIFSLSGEPAGVQIDSVTGEISWTPNEEQGGITHTFQVVVRETGSTNEDQGDLSIQVLEDDIAPEMAPLDDVALHVGQTETFQIPATDADLPAQVLSYTMSGAPMGATIDQSTGTFTFSPQAIEAGRGYNVTITVTDPTGYSASQTFNLRIGQPFDLTCEEDGNAAVISFRTIVGETYDLEICDDLVGDNWSLLQAVSANTPVSSVVDTNLQNLNRCFFRIVHTH